MSVICVTNWSGLESVCIKRFRFTLTDGGKRGGKITESGNLLSCQNRSKLKKVL